MESIEELRKYCKDRDALLVLTAYKLNELADAIEAEVAERYVALPLDADGVPVRIGDVMEWDDTSTAEVVGVGDGTFFYVEDGEAQADWSCAKYKVHHYEPTVESTLREMLAEIGEGGVYAEDVLLAKYAPRLRLAGDGE